MTIKQINLYVVELPCTDSENGYFVVSGTFYIAETDSGPIVENGRLRPAELPVLGVTPGRNKIGDPVAVFTGDQN